jgi:hypothetical protein
MGTVATVCCPSFASNGYGAINSQFTNEGCISNFLGLFVDIDVLETQEQQFYSDKV